MMLQHLLKFILFDCLYFHINREEKLVQRANRHLKRTDQKFEDEAAFSQSTFNSLEDDVINYENRVVKQFHLVTKHSVDDVKTLRSVAEKEATTRQKEDVVVLDTVMKTQRLLQEMVRVSIADDNISS